MNLHLNLRANNDAFAMNAENEIARILKHLAARIEINTIHPGKTFVLRDINGDNVGLAVIEE